jgi:Holliday junction DNA helicase RuvA
MMIGSLRGTVLERGTDGTVLIEVAGVGYSVHVSPRTLAELEPTSPAFLYVHHHIREDAQTLFGFLHRDEKSTFQTLIATHGVGPSLALAILSTHAPRALVDIVTSGDIASLTLVPGVGKKTAERLLIELKNRLDLPATSSEGPRSGSSSTSDVREALIGLGYSDGEIREALRGIDADSDSATMLREALRLLAVRRA